MGRDIEFRDGFRHVPDHIADTVLSGIETRKYTYKEAIAAGNRKMEADQIYRGQQNIIRAHFNEKEF